MVHFRERHEKTTEPTGQRVQRGTPLPLTWQRLLQVFQKEKGTAISLPPGTSYGDEKEKAAISSQDKFFSDRKGCLNSQQQKDDLSQKWGKNPGNGCHFRTWCLKVPLLGVFIVVSFSLLNLPTHTIIINSNIIFNNRAHQLSSQADQRDRLPAHIPQNKGWSDHETLQQGGGLTLESVPVGPTGHCYLKYATLMGQLQTTTGITLEPLLRELWKRGQWFFILHT